MTVSQKKSSVVQENWKDLIKPSNINIKEVKDPQRHVVIEVEPLERGFGLTLGNALRRVLLSSLRGFAVTSIKIEGVLHEYGVIKGVKEDMADIIMNIKSLIIRRDGIAPASIHLFADKQGVVYAKDIKVDNDIEILNPDLAICTLDKGASIDITMTIENGAGYKTSEQNKKPSAPVGTIAIDSIFSPIVKVSYVVGNARVGQMTDFDKLILDIETNGSVSPEDAVALAAKILQDQLQGFVNFDISEIKGGEGGRGGNGDLNPSLLKSIDELELSVRSYNCLKNEGIKYVGDLVTKTEAEMLKTSNFGRKSLNELKDNLNTMGLSFGMKLDSAWPPENIEEISKKTEESFY